MHEYYYRPRSEGDNVIGSVRMSVCLSSPACLFVCNQYGVCGLSRGCGRSAFNIFCAFGKDITLHKINQEKYGLLTQSKFSWTNIVCQILPPEHASSGVQNLNEKE